MSGLTNRRCQGDRGDSSTMCTERHLALGLDALCRAYEGNYFTDGHRGAALVAAHFLCQETHLEEGAAETIATVIDEWCAQTPPVAPFPPEAAEPAGLERIVRAMARNLGPLKQAGHNVIFPSLALKAFAALPAAVTPARVEGICALVERFDSTDALSLSAAGERPPFGVPETMAEFILAETLATMQAFDGRGQGWSGHMLTHGRAVVDLLQLGYTDLARQAWEAFALYVKRVRLGPLDTDRSMPEHPRGDCGPLEARYWESRRGADLGLGHALKYPYGFYGLMALAGDPQLKQRCLDQAYRVF